MVWVTSFLCVTAAIVFYQDLRTRSVVWFVFPVLLLLGALNAFINKQSWGVILTNISLNLAFLGVQFLLLILYFRIKKEPVTSLKKKIGPGDVLFVVSCCSIFAPLNFLVFYLLSLLFSLIVFLVFISKSTAEKSVPLAGLQAFFLILLIVANLLVKNNMANDSWLIEKIFAS